MKNPKRKTPPPPMTAMLLQSDNTTRFHMPGHKGRLDMYDTTELARTDDLYAPISGIAGAEALAAKSCGAAHTIMLSGGSTAGLMAMVLSTVAPGETLILPRNAHHAAVSACIWGGVDAAFADNPLAALAAHPHAKAVLLTRPDYYGRCIDLAPIVEAAHAQGTLVLVDEAHGAHFAWWSSPASAGKLGADAWVQSAHKTLPALTGAAWLHLSKDMDAARARRFLRMVHTSSPSFPILQSLDEAREWMDQYGVQALNNVQTMLSDFRGKLAQVGGYTIPPMDDPTRLVIHTRGRGYTGFAVQEEIAKHGIDVEMADAEGIVCIGTVADEPAMYDRLLAALKYLPQTTSLPEDAAFTLPPPGPRAMPLREAALAPQQAVPLIESAGRICAVSAGMYPPGTPVILPGETITPDSIVLLNSIPPAHRFGIEADAILCTKR